MASISQKLIHKQAKQAAQCRYMGSVCAINHLSHLQMGGVLHVRLHSSVPEPKAGYVYALSAPGFNAGTMVWNVRIENGAHSRARLSITEVRAEHTSTVMAAHSNSRAFNIVVFKNHSRRKGETQSPQTEVKSVESGTGV
jgi:hypothetical protein